MSRPDRAPRVAVDFSPRGKRRRSRTPALAVGGLIVMLVAVVLGVSQLLLH